jgi:hypothetical protein
MMARGLFHSIEAVSKSGLLALEFETPVNKNDLVRFKDNYGREKKAYEGKKFTQSIESKFIKFKTPKFGKKQTYKIGKVNVALEVHKNFIKLLKNKNSNIFAILDGSISDNKGRNVLSYGDIIKTDDLRILSKVFKIKKKLSVVRVY